MELLNASKHRDVTMTTLVANHPHCVQVVLSEMSHAATCCPLFFVKDSETGRFHTVALFGFSPGELLVEETAQGAPAFVPLDIARQGFFADGANIAIDLTHPRFTQGGSIALFDSAGEATDEMRLIQRTIGTLISARTATEAFVAEMLRLRLIEPVDISLSFDDGQNLTLEGLYTISLDLLADLADADVLALYRKGYLAAALCIQGSQRQVQAMARRRNEALSRG